MINLDTVNIRQATADDLPFIEQMCYEAGFPESLGVRPAFEDARQLEWFQEYTRNWPNQKGDFGLIAEDQSSRPIGAAWYRNYPREGLPADIPTHELSIALVKEARGKRIGKRLLLDLMEGAAQRGVERLALQVNENNERAKELYKKVGFLTVTKSHDVYDVMVATTQM